MAKQSDKFGPLLAADGSGVQLRYPVLVSPKLDGIRCVVHEGKAMSRAMKPIANEHVRTTIEAAVDMLHNVDGELMVGEAFSSTTSGIMSRAGKPDFRFHLFDIHSDARPFHERFRDLMQRQLPPFCIVVPHRRINNDEELETYYKAMLQTFEGVMVRDPYGRYKQGRSTEKEAILLKLKPFADSEAVIVGFEEMQENTNEATENELGYKHRSSHLSGMVGKGTLGKFVVCGNQTEHFGGVEFSVGTGVGLTHELRQEIWNNRDKYLGKLIKFKYQQVGSIDKPRIPIFLGFRDVKDL